MSRGRVYTNGICRCGHVWTSHGYIGGAHWCSGRRHASQQTGEPCNCVRYVRDRRRVAA